MTQLTVLGEYTRHGEVVTRIKIFGKNQINSEIIPPVKCVEECLIVAELCVLTSIFVLIFKL